MKTSLLFVVLLCSVLDVIHGGIQCIDSSGKPVDWFIIYKLPEITDNSHSAIREGVGFYYLDVNAQFWVLSDIPINATGGHALWYTLEQIYENHNSKDVIYALYNDEKPAGQKSMNHGHTKGDLAFDKDSGFWLVHSVPRFPPMAADGYAYPSSGHSFGQTMLCVSYNTTDLNNIGKQLMYNYPWVYDSNLPDDMATDFPNIAAVLSRKHVEAAPWERIAAFNSLGGQKFVSFAKFTDFEADLYDRLVAPYFKSPLLVETWQNGKEKSPSNCSTTFQVMNVQTLSVSGVDFKETKDHSKWAVTTDLDQFSSARPWICVGDINRMGTQWHRAGGTVCSILPDAWLAFMKAIQTIEKC